MGVKSNDYGIFELLEINRPVVCVIDSLDEAQGIPNKLKEIKSIISFVIRLNDLSQKYGLYAYPIVIVFTIREEYWREWESLFEGLNVKHFFKISSEFNEEEIDCALEKYQRTYHYSIHNNLSRDDILTLSNPLNLYIFSETHKFRGNIEVEEVFTASVLHNFFKLKSEEIFKRRVLANTITPRIFLDICENFLSQCVYKSLRLNKEDFFESLDRNTPLFRPYAEELLRIYDTELIFRFDEEGILVIRHMKFFEYLYADYMIRKCIVLNKLERKDFLEAFINKINSAKIVDLIEIYNNVRYIYSISNIEKTVQKYLDESNEFVRIRLSDLRCRIALGIKERIDDYNQIVEGKNISNGNLLLEAFFVCSAKCNSPNREELLSLFVKAWKSNKDSNNRWRLLPKLNMYDLLDEKKVMAQIIKSSSWKEWQVYLGYLIEKYDVSKFLQFMQESEECNLQELINEGGEWNYVKVLLDKCQKL